MAERGRGDGLLALAALSGAVAIAAGAFGAHGARGMPAEWLRTGGLYEMVHAVAAVALLAFGARARGPAWLLLGGSALFAGTLYAMALGATLWLGRITPLGGLAMIIGWLWFAVVAWRGRLR